MKGRGRKKAPEVTAHSRAAQRNTTETKRKPTGSKVATFQTKGGGRAGRRKSARSSVRVPAVRVMGHVGECGL